MANRTRNNGIYLMLSDDELKVLEKKYKLSNYKSMRQFIMKCILERNIFVLDMSMFRKMSASIGRITGNINQIAKRINQTGIIYKDDINDIRILLEKQGKDIYFLRKKIYELSNLGTLDLEEV